MEPKYIVKTAIRQGLNGIAITDHDTIRGGLKTAEYSERDFEVIIGSEILTHRGEIIGLFLSEEIQSRDFFGAIEEIQNQNGIVIVPHPFDTLRKSALYPTEKDAKMIEGIEGFNGRSVFQKSNTEAIEFGMRNKLAITAGSDAHFLNEVGNAGIITDSDDIKEAIISKNITMYGRKNSLYNHVLTKGLKLCRKIKQF
jgi:predicted metal-dependent phosphoesterase TrpH